ncbi:MAG: DUF115 domain-containing protein [Sulfurimonas sp.]|nr:DUF115 domain-containing protein [Sulfurimonas sp.]MDD3834151.1 DUF115 domain-containing protein [Sulfurimonas sp.]
MQKIEEIAVLNYQNNMDYFQKEHNQLYKKLLALETLLEDGTYPQKYDLEYKDSYFDVIELASQSYLYKQNSEIYSDALASQITFKKSDQVFESFYKFDFTQKALEKLERESALTTYATSAPIMHYHSSNVDSSMHMNEIQKFIFIGLGLALHLPKIIKKTDAKLILIIEDNIELFRLSLFTCDYKGVLDGRLAFFSIGENNSEFINTFTTFYSKSFVRNYLLKFSLFSSAYEHKIKDIQTRLVSRTETSYPIEYLLYKNITILSRLKENFKFLELSKKTQEQFFSDKPMLVLGAGPSLYENIEWLKNNAHNFVLVVVFAALKTLYKLNIKPDIVVHIDEKITETVNLINSFKDFDFVQNSIFVFSASAPDILFETFQKDNIYLIEDRTKYRLANTRLESASVGETAYAISLIFNAKEIYLLGLDFALSDDGSTHAKDHHNVASLDTSTAHEVQQSLSIDKSTLSVRGNFRDKVTTTPLLLSSIPVLDKYTKELKSNGQTVYNLSDGAFLESTLPLRVSELSIDAKLDKQSFVFALKEIFDNYSLRELSPQERQQLKNTSVQLDEFHSLIDSFEQNTSSNKDVFIQNYATLMQSIISSQESELKELLTIHFLGLAPYIFDIFNSKELQNPKRHTKKLKKVIALQLRRLLEPFEEALKKALEEI